MYDQQIGILLTCIFILQKQTFVNIAQHQKYPSLASFHTQDLQDLIFLIDFLIVEHIYNTYSKLSFRLDYLKCQASYQSQFREQLENLHQDIKQISHKKLVNTLVMIKLNVVSD
eukprot:TRINITY_DN3178_c0_g1_i2.p3 TRINITY_DN3178_c0_g1~~TRINITY_DN3178_c0_g1_i2.p3  ORF type:complete len:114 (-),score=0.19 TRINITY_DN3178_c0_g1_i2:863-1204(-)